MKNTRLKKIPKFKNEAEEKSFWQKKDSTEYLDWSKAIKNPSLPKLNYTPASPVELLS